MKKRLATMILCAAMTASILAGCKTGKESNAPADTAAGTAKDAVDRLRERGEKAGLIKIRLFRPFPAEAIAEALKNVKAIAVMDRAEGYTNHGGPLGADVMAALFRAKSPAHAINIVYGLGGRDVRVGDIENVFEDLNQIIKDGDAGETYRYMGIRE